MRKEKDTTEAPQGERLQKILARAGVASRRAAETIIREGRVRVNGRIVKELGTRADPKDDRIELDGTLILAERPVYILIHKPRGVVATLRDPEGRPSVGDMLATLGVRAYPIGRLDFATSGVLLATNDGDFSNALLHPRGGVPKRYVVKVAGKMEDADLERWRRGVELDDGRTLPAEVDLIRHEADDESGAGAARKFKTWFELTIREGRNQQIRRMGEATHFPVMRLARTSFAGVTSEGLAPGRWRYLTRQELVELKKTYGVPKRIPHDLPEGGGEGASTAPSRRAESRRGGYATDDRERSASERGPNTHDRGASRARRVAVERAGATERGATSRDRGGATERGANVRERGGSTERGANTHGRGGSTERGGNVRERRSVNERGAPARERGGANERAHAGSGSSGHARERSAAKPRGNSGERERSGTTTGARYGFGAPARRDPDVSEDYGGGVRRGASSHDQRTGDESRGQQGRSEERPKDERRGDSRRGRAAMPMRTTGKNTYGK